MRLGSTAVLLGLLAVTPAGASAQSAESFADIGRHVSLGARVRIDERAGGSTHGRLLAITPEQIVLATGAGERRLAPEAVAAVAVKRSYARRAALIGALAGAALCIPCTTGEHADRDAPFLTGLLGAAAGAITGAFVPRLQVVYRAGAVAAAPRAGRGGAGIAVVVRW